jgi:pimeloyl-ACP methyl ester carboxylesterase
LVAIGGNKRPWGMEVSRGDGSVIRVEAAGEQRAAPVLFCHGVADSRLSARVFAQAARELGLRVVAPDRPGPGGTDPRRLRRLADWVEDAGLVPDALSAGSAALVGISAGGPFAAACAARMAGPVRSLTLDCPLGPPGWPTRGMAPGERLSLAIARHAPAFGGWFLGGLAALRAAPRGCSCGWPPASCPASTAARSPSPACDSFLAHYLEAFRRGSWGVAQDLRLLTQPWGFELGAIGVPTVACHRDADTTVPPQHPPADRRRDTGRTASAPPRPWPLLDRRRRPEDARTARRITADPRVVVHLEAARTW